MKKSFCLCGLPLLLTACGRRETAVESNLILTNYSSTAIANLSVTHDGAAAASSEAGIADTQIRAFALPEEARCAYTVSFETADGETVAGDFTDDFTGGNTGYLRAERTEGGWRLEYDEPS